MLVGTYNQEKALVGAFSVIVQPVVEPMDRFAGTTFYPGPAETASVAGARNYETSRHQRAASILSLIMCVQSLGPLFCLLIDKVGGRIPFCVGELILFTDRLRRQICSFSSELHKMTMICRLCHADAYSRKFPKDYGSRLE